MPGVARHGDPCGGTIIATAIRTFVNGVPVARLGDSVTPHGEGEHAVATMETASAGFFAEGKAVCRKGDRATCGHTVTEASGDVFADGPDPS